MKLMKSVGENILEGNLLDIEEGIIVHGCNCQGVMGSGVAAAVREKYPEIHKIYTMCTPNLTLGEIQIFMSNKYSDNLINPMLQKFWSVEELPEKLVVVNALTQFNYGTHKRQVDYDAIRSCFAQVAILAKNFKKPPPIYYPMIGAGLGGGDWNTIGDRIDDALLWLDHTLIVLPQRN